VCECVSLRLEDRTVQGSSCELESPWPVKLAGRRRARTRVRLFRRLRPRPHLFCTSFTWPSSGVPSYMLPRIVMPRLNRYLH
jgi:hypothetical protein